MPKAVNIPAKRAAFVLASLDVIASEGLGGATLRRIAAQAGATTGSITHYFSSREALLVETVAAAHLTAGARMQAALERCETPEDQLDAVVLEALPLDPVRMREWKVWLAFRGAIAGEPTLTAANGIGYETWRGLLHRLLKPFFGEAESLRRETALLEALVDGIGFRLAVFADGAVQLAGEQRRTAKDVRAYLKALRKRAKTRAPK